MRNFLAIVIVLALAALTILTLVSALGGAPAPVQRHKQPTSQITTGKYVLNFSGGNWDVNLYHDGRYTAEKSGWIWYGKWEWDKEERILKVSEAPSGWNYLNWEVKLDNNLDGKTKCGGWQISMKRCK